MQLKIQQLERQVGTYNLMCSRARGKSTASRIWARVEVAKSYQALDGEVNSASCQAPRFVKGGLTLILDNQLVAGSNDVKYTLILVTLDCCDADSLPQKP